MKLIVPKVETLKKKQKFWICYNSRGLHKHYEGHYLYDRDTNIPDIYNDRWHIDEGYVSYFNRQVGMLHLQCEVSKRNFKVNLGLDPVHLFKYYI